MQASQVFTFGHQQWNNDAPSLQITSNETVAAGHSSRYKCTVCDINFTRRSTLNRHFATLSHIAKTSVNYD